MAVAVAFDHTFKAVVGAGVVVVVVVLDVVVVVILVVLTKVGVNKKF